MNHHQRNVIDVYEELRAAGISRQKAGYIRSLAELVLSGELDVILPPRFGRSVAAEIPNARFEVMGGEAHQPFQEIPDEFNARVDAFWREAEARG